MQKVLEVAAIAAGVWVATQLVSGLSFEGSWLAFTGVAVLIALANMIVRPVLKILSFPAIILSLGLFLLVINAILLQLVLWLADSDRLDLGFTSTGFFWATFLGALVISIVRGIIDLALIRD